MSVNIAVLGAGVIGLSTVINVQRVFPNARVTVIADKFYEDTTSYGSGGMFIPSIQALPNTPVEDLRKWNRASWDFYRQIALSPNASEVGTIIMSGYNLINKPLSPKNRIEADRLLTAHPQLKIIPLFSEHVQIRQSPEVNVNTFTDPLYKECVFSCEKMSLEEMKDLGFQHFRVGYRVTTIIIFMRKYLLWLQKKFEENGGRYEKKHIRSIEEISDDYDLVMNCCGAGSGVLVHDTKAQPVRGHIVRVRAPWIKHWVLTDDNTYVIPGEDFVGLGTVKQVGKENLDVDPKDTKDIVERCEKLCPFLKGAKIDHEWIGLRPGRDRIRLESEMMKFGNKQIPVVHNYGHSSQGIGLSWGTAVYAAKIASEILAERRGSKL